MENPEYLSERQAEELSLSEFIRAARKTLEERHEQMTLQEHFGILAMPTTSPVSDSLNLTVYDRKLLEGMRIKGVEEPEASAD